jgi:hypothetical protein
MSNSDAIWNPVLQSSMFKILTSLFVISLGYVPTVKCTPCLAKCLNALFHSVFVAGGGITNSQYSPLAQYYKSCRNTKVNGHHVFAWFHFCYGICLVDTLPSSRKHAKPLREFIGFTSFQLVDVLESNTKTHHLQKSNVARNLIGIG